VKLPSEIEVVKLHVYEGWRHWVPLYEMSTLFSGWSVVRVAIGYWSLTSDAGHDLRACRNSDMYSNAMLPTFLLPCANHSFLQQVDS